jgi:hypothetical protein
VLQLEQSNYARFYDFFNEFYQEAERKTDEADHKVKTLEEDIKVMIMTFGEDPNSIKPGEFFDMFSKFAKDVINV